MNHGAYSFTDTPTDNPYNVNHGYGNTYTYQAVFTPVSSSTSPTPTSTVPEYSSAAAVLVAAILLVVAFGGIFLQQESKKIKSLFLFFGARLKLLLLPHAGQVTLVCAIRHN